MGSLLAQHREARRRRPVSTGEHDVVPLGHGRPQAVNAPRRQRPLALDPVEKRVRRLEELARRLSLLRVVEDRRKAALQLPRVEEERPVDVRTELGDGRLHDPRAGEGRHGEVVRVPDDRRAALAGRPEREERPTLALGVERAQSLLLDAILAVERRSPGRVEERADDADDP